MWEFNQPHIIKMAGRISFYSALVFAVISLLAGNVSAQVDDFCREYGAVPTLEGPRLSTPYIFGRVNVQGIAPNGKFPKIVVILQERSQAPNRVTVSRSGTYCFRRIGGDGGLRVEVDGVEVDRRQIASFGTPQQREDFDIFLNKNALQSPPAVVSSKFARPPNAKTAGLYEKTSEAERAKDVAATIAALSEIITLDKDDYIAFAKLGAIYFEQSQFTNADAAFRKALELRVDYTPAWINVGKMRLFQKQYAAAIEIFKQAISTDPTSPRGYQLLGESYLQNKQGTLAVEALNQAIKLDPRGMAECHLLLARLYELAGAKKEATRELKLFLVKIPDHPDRKKFEKFIRDNPE